MLDEDIRETDEETFGECEELYGPFDMDAACTGDGEASAGTGVIVAAEPNCAASAGVGVIVAADPICAASVVAGVCATTPRAGV